MKKTNLAKDIHVDEQTATPIELPLYIKILDNFFIAALLIPIGCWLFFVIHFNTLPPLEYKKVLNYLWGSSVFFLFLTWGLECLVKLILKARGLDVIESDGNGGYVFNVESTYKMALKTSFPHKLLILFYIHLKFFLMFIFGWGVFGGIIKFFSLNSY